jgi:flagellar hook-associated protein 2
MGTINSFGNVLLPAGSTTIDVQSLLNTAITAAQAPLTLLQKQQTTIQSQTSALQSISGDVTALNTAIQALTTSNGALNALTSTSSNTNVLTASADSTALTGTHSIVVNSLATTASYYTNPVASATTTLANGSFQIAVGSGAPATVTINSTDQTLNGLASAINAQNLGVTASVITDANGARLAIVSNTSGGSGTISIASNTTGLTFNQAATGANASLTVDGVPVSSTSNTVVGAIPGVTLNLAGAAPGQTVSLVLAPNTDQASSAVSTFVSAWNKVVQDINNQFNVSPDGTGGGPLETDNNLRDLQNQLLSAITYSISGNNGLVNLASIGVNMNTDGTLSLDSGKLTNVLNGNYAALQNLLQGSSGVGAFLSSTLSQITDPTQGTIALDLQGMSQTNDSLTQQINDMQTLLTSQTQSLTQQYAQMAVTLQEMPQLQEQMTQQLAALTSNG